MSIKKFVLPSNLLGKNLRLFRKSKRLSMQNLAEIIESSAGYISDIENGKAVPGGNFLYSLRRAFNINIDSLFSENNAETFLAEEKSEEYGKTSDGNPEISNIVQILQSQIEDLKKDKDRQNIIIDGLNEDKARIREELTELKKEMASLEKRQTGS